jgi:hypothetical protein
MCKIFVKLNVKDSSVFFFFFFSVFLVSSLVFLSF